jgi:hypothetical protein
VQQPLFAVARARARPLANNAPRTRMQRASPRKSIMKVYVDSATSPLPNEPELVARCLELGLADAEHAFSWIAIRNPRHETRLFIQTSCEGQEELVVELLRAMPLLCELPCPSPAAGARAGDVRPSHLFLITH